MKLLMMFTADLVYSYCTTVSGGPGLKVQCPDQMYAQGWCSSGKDKNCCTGRCSHELKCCSTRFRAITVTTSMDTTASLSSAMLTRQLSEHVARGKTQIVVQDF